MLHSALISSASLTFAWTKAVSFSTYIFLGSMDFTYYLIYSAISYVSLFICIRTGLFATKSSSIILT